MASKIEKYELQDRTLALSVTCPNHDEIARILTEELEGKDTISQTTVSRWIRKVREQRKEVAGAILVDYLQESLPSDLKMLDELAQFHLVIFRGKLVGTIEGDEDAKKIEPITLPDRRVAARDIHEILKTKFRFLGIDPGDKDGTGIHPVDLDQFRREEKGLKEKEGNG